MSKEKRISITVDYIVTSTKSQCLVATCTTFLSETGIMEAGGGSANRRAQPGSTPRDRHRGEAVGSSSPMPTDARCEMQNLIVVPLPQRPSHERWIFSDEMRIDREKSDRAIQSVKYAVRTRGVISDLTSARLIFASRNAISTSFPLFHPPPRTRTPNYPAPLSRIRSSVRDGRASRRNVKDASSSSSC